MLITRASHFYVISGCDFYVAKYIFSAFITDKSVALDSSRFYLYYQLASTPYLLFLLDMVWWSCCIHQILGFEVWSVEDDANKFTVSKIHTSLTPYLYHAKFFPLFRWRGGCGMVDVITSLFCSSIEQQAGYLKGFQFCSVRAEMMNWYLRSSVILLRRTVVIMASFAGQNRPVGQ